MSSTVLKIEEGRFGLTLTDPNVTDVCDATLADFGDGFTCQITSGALNASPNVSQETVPATWCSPEQTVPQVGETSYTLDLSFLQDPQVMNGLSRFLFENDTREAWFFMGLDGDNPPKAMGKARLVSGTIGGAGRTALTATISLPVSAKPAICFGDAADSEAVNNPTETPTAVTPGTPGSFTPATAIPANLAALQAIGALGQSTAWTTGQHVILGDASQAHWDGATWAAGAA
jgi:hypothetical protein